MFFLLQADIEVINNEYTQISTQEWVEVLKRAKRSNTSSVFLKRNYPVYKCEIESTRLTNLLVKCLNLKIKNTHVLSRWVNLVDVMLEKSKGNILGKLRKIQLVEGASNSR